MKIAITGATGFLGRYLVRQLASEGHQLRCWYRPTSDRSGLEDAAASIEWIPGALDDPDSCAPLIEGCDAVVHAALWRPGPLFQGAEGDIVKFAEINVVGSLRLIDAAVTHRLQRFVFISTCAVHDRILDDRPLDERHPLWPASHYGATRPPWRSLCTAMGSDTVSRSVHCVRRGFTAWPIPWKTASGTNWSETLRSRNPSAAGAVARKSMPRTSRKP